MVEFTLIHHLIIFVFVIGYSAIAFEYYLKVNKTASATLMAVVTWVLLFIHQKGFTEYTLSQINFHLGEISQIIFFLMTAMTLVELIDSHKGFKIITDLINTKSKRKLLWIIGLIAFFLSAILDNLTTTIVMISLIRKIIPERKDRMILCSTVVIAANAGGAWTPIGDVTTTMLWIKGQVTSIAVMKALFLPSFFSIIVTLFLLGIKQQGKYPPTPKVEEKTEPGGTLVFCVGIGALVFVPIFHYITGLPPFMGMLIGLGVLWLITDIMHCKYESRHHLRIPYVLTKIDMSAVMFFLGILLTINVLESVGILKSLAIWLEVHIGNLAVIASAIGFLSAIVDNVPLVAACIGMYDLAAYPPDSPLWQMIAYAAGNGGSILIIGSAAGVALMGIEKVDFLWYLKKISLTALAGYLAGMALYLLLNTFYI